MRAVSTDDLQKLTHSELIALVKRDILRVMNISQFNPLDMTKEQTPEYKEFEHLKGHPISQSAAARKYDVPQASISRWVARGLIARLGMDKNRVLIDEADIAYCAKIAHDNAGSGKWLFNHDGTPYNPKRS